MLRVKSQTLCHVTAKWLGNRTNDCRICRAHVSDLDTLSTSPWLPVQWKQSPVT